MGSLDASRTLIAALSDPATYGGGVDSVRVIETHISWVFLTGELAYKVKKPVRLPFLDFSTLDARHRYCDEELRLNRRLAPEIYLDVVPIGGAAAEPRIGATPAIEYAVKMVEFPSRARLDRVIEDGKLADGAIEAFAERLVAFHRDLPPAPGDSDYGFAATVRRAAEKNLEQAREADGLTAADGDAIGAWLREEGALIARLLTARKDAGAVCECHGDLHLENLVAWHGKVVAFDALEFDVALRSIDTIDEVAFLTMDFLAHARPDLGCRFLNRYLEVGGDYGALPLLRFYMVHRALVRAKVRALGAGPSAPYVELARRLCGPAQPTLAITHGFSGSGKTTWTSALLAALPAVRLRSDIVRKRRAGLSELESSDSPLGGGLYSARQNETTYAALADAAGDTLRAGFNVIVDATFLRLGERRRFAALAADRGARFRILDFQAAPETLRARIAARNARSNDASEASLAVLDSQLERAEPLGADELAQTIRVDTETESSPDGIDALVAHVLEPVQRAAREPDLCHE